MLQLFHRHPPHLEQKLEWAVSFQKGWHPLAHMFTKKVRMSCGMSPRFLQSFNRSYIDGSFLNIGRRECCRGRKTGNIPNQDANSLSPMTEFWHFINRRNRHISFKVKGESGNSGSNPAATCSSSRWQWKVVNVKWFPKSSSSKKRGPKSCQKPSGIGMSSSLSGSRLTTSNTPVANPCLMIW